MDISYLLWLQGIRESLPSIVEQFFIIISAIAGSSALVVLPCLLYWCLDKRGGQFLVFTFSLGSLCNQLIKNAVCAYRPWMRSELVHPSEAALPGATGYSFPSGHTQTAATLIGATGWQYRRKWPWLNVLCWVFVLLTAFSRNYLGVHTPQDVIVAIVESIAVIAASGALLSWIDRANGRDTIVLVCSTVLLVAYLAYIALKQYPVHYDLQGVILADPYEMQIDCFKSGGVFYGAILGWYLERRIVRFQTLQQGGWKRIVLRLAIGFAIIAVLHLAPRVLLLVNIDTRWYELIKNFFTIFGAVFVAPLVFNAIERRTGFGMDMDEPADEQLADEQLTDDGLDAEQLDDYGLDDEHLADDGLYDEQLDDEQPAELLAE